MTERTPGPWRLTYSNCWIVGNDPVLGDIVLAKMDRGTLADARVLAAAHSLLFALQYALPFIPENAITAEAYENGGQKVADVVRAAIAEATGGAT